MGKCSIKKLTKLRVVFLTLAFLLILYTNNYNFAYADVSGSTTGVTSMNMKFTDSVREGQLGYVSGYIPVLNVTMGSQLDSYYFVVEDCNGNTIYNSLFQGQILAEESQYPLTIRIVPTPSADTWYMNVKITFKEEAEALDEVITKMDTLASKLDELREKLKSIQDTLSNTLNTLNHLDDFLSNPAYLELGMNDLKNSVDNLSSKNIVNDAGSTQSKLNDLSSGGGDSDFNIPFDYMGIKINCLDFSAILNYLSSIRSLLVATIWIEFAVFCIRIIVPKFKV